MESVVITDFGVSLHKTSERLVVRGPRPRLELIEGGPQLLLPVDLPSAPPALKVVSTKKARQRKGPQEGSEASDTRSIPKQGPVLTEVPFFRISEIVVASSGVSISTDLIEECCTRGIRISFLTLGGQPYAMLSSPMLTATVITRREQLAAYHDERGLELARAVIRGKLNNQANLLKYFAKYLRASEADTLPQVEAAIRSMEGARRDAERVPGRTIDEARPSFLAIEGRAGKTYWQTVKLLLENRVPFEGREHRGATDQVNAALNYGYGILYAQVWGAIMNAGLEPFAGFLHVDRPGKPSLVLDLIEEFRQPLVDRPVIAAFNKGTQLTMRNGLLDEASRRLVADSVLERLDSEVPFRGKRYRLRSIIQMQARAVASFVRREGSYRSYSWKW
ncbi:MAG: CRISPR-associated endonuclease Cas1 [Candidatus Methylomirabilales bacterium]